MPNDSRKQQHDPSHRPNQSFGLARFSPDATPPNRFAMDELHPASAIRFHSSRSPLLRVGDRCICTPDCRVPQDWPQSAPPPVSFYISGMHQPVERSPQAKGEGLWHSARITEPTSSTARRAHRTEYNISCRTTRSKCLTCHHVSGARGLLMRGQLS